MAIAQQRPTWTRRLAALATALAGLATTVSSLSPNAPARERLLEALEPGVAQSAAHALGVVGGLATIWLALGVLQGRRSSGRAAMVVLGVLAIVHAAKGLDYEEALLGLAVAAALHRGLRSGASAALTGALMVLVALAGAYAVALTYLLLAGGSPHFGATLFAAAKTVVWAAATPSGVAATGLHMLVAFAIGSLVMLLRAVLAPARPREGHGEDEHRRLAGLVALHGEDSIAPFALRADKAFHFAAGGALAYRALRETAVVAGDPIGPPGSAGPVIASFVDHAYRSGWDVVVLGAREEHLGDYTALGLRTMQVGLEAVVDPQGFRLDTPAAKTVRKAVSRVRRHGWTIELVSGAELADVSADLAAVELAWRRRAGHRRLYGFAMAHDRLWGAPEDVSDLYAIARNPDGEARAFQRYVRYRRGYSLDAMRRLDDEPNGVADSLVAAVLGRAREEGCTEVSLNFSGFGHLMAADTLELRSHRIARWALRRMHGRFQLERLARFAQKFGPEWRPRHLVYTARTRLPLAAVRVLQAEAYLKTQPPRPAHDAWLPSPIPLPARALVAPRR
jgi:lysyl-tRNA synthetase class 2